MWLRQTPRDRQSSGFAEAPAYSQLPDACAPLTYSIHAKRAASDINALSETCKETTGRLLRSNLMSALGVSPAPVAWPERQSDTSEWPPL